MKLATFIMLVAICGKISTAVPVAYRLGYYRAAPPQDDVEDSEEVEAEISAEDFSHDQIQDDDDDSDEQESPPQFNKLFPLPQANSPGHNYPLAIMMGEINHQGWNVPKHPHQIPKNNKNRARLDELDMTAHDDEDDDDDSEEDEEEDDEPEDDLPDWNKLFPNVDSQGQGPPASVVDTSSAPELPASFRSGLGSRVVYVPASQLARQQLRRPMTTVPRQYIMKPQALLSRTQYMYNPSMSYVNRQPMVIRGRPQQQHVLMATSGSRIPQQMVHYMPVRRGTYSPYATSYVPRYRH